MTNRRLNRLFPPQWLPCVQPLKPMCTPMTESFAPYCCCCTMMQMELLGPGAQPLRPDIPDTARAWDRLRPYRNTENRVACLAIFVVHVLLLGLVCVSALRGTRDTPRGIRLPDATTARHAEPVWLMQPPERRAVNGLLNTTLRVNVKHVAGPGPLHYTARTYEGLPFGPTLRVRAGDTLAFTLVNELEADLQENGPPMPFTLRLPNTTNIHLHGLHVSPAGIADNIFRTVPPQTSARSVYHIPKTHQSGAFYYHPHHEGSSLVQAMASMAGFVVVEDPHWAPAELTRMREIMMGMQEIRVSGVTASSYVIASHKANSTLPLGLKQVSYPPRIHGVCCAACSASLTPSLPHSLILSPPPPSPRPPPPSAQTTCWGQAVPELADAQISLGYFLCIK